MRKVKILFADDDELARLNVRECVEKEGWELIEAIDGQEAWEKYQQTSPQVVVLDVDMPKRNGLEVALLIRDIDLITPIIMYSSLISEKDLLAGLEHGAKHYIIKDYSPNILVRQIKTVLPQEISDLFYLAQNVTFHLTRHELCKKGECYTLRQIHGNVLAALCRNANRLTPRNLLLEAGWKSTQINYEAQLNKTINFLKGILQDVPGVKIKTEFGMGYWLMVDTEIS